MPIKAVLFDYMGTCLDWHTGICNILPSSIPQPDRSDFALEWRQLYFDTNAARQARGDPPEDIDITHRTTLDEMLTRSRWQPHANLFTEDVKTKSIAQWHHQTAWDDTRPALLRLRQRGYEVFVHANGTTRLQLDITRSAGLGDCFDMLFSSELLGSIKPARENYERCLGLIKRKAEECVMVAAHGYDVRGAKATGMKTVYIYRWTDDIHEDHEKMKGEFDAYLEGGMQGLDEVVARL
ncbi:hypothetical protein PRZ48_012005 [Zasmidium cellare]|uniref:Haloacid dehalogenase n=1 Tax=Zasmidium cellare TaxID=395010 RepID=A0ABR0E7Z9_ZASCE|nr:hypothetical protein PRZ48_012005 [Zasmidium cellare]